jgi:PAS domain S-box-containing protein
MLDFLLPTTAGLTMLAGGIPPLVAVFWLRNERQKPAVLWFQCFLVCGLIWSVSFGMIALVDVPQFRFVMTNVLILVIPGSAVFYFLFCYEFTFKKKPPTAVFVLFVPVALLFVLGWINPYNLVYTMDNPQLTDQILIPANEGSIRPLVTVGLGYTLVLMSTGMVCGELMSTSHRSRRIQAAIILVSSLTVGTFGIIKVLDLVPPYFDPTPIGWTLSGVLFAISIRRYQFLQLSPAAHEQITNEIEDLLLVLGPNDVVTNVSNTSGNEFDIRVGMTKHELQQHNPELNTLIETQQSGTVEIQTETGTQFFDARYSTLKHEHGAAGAIVILRNVTDRKTAERALETTKERYQRMLRWSSDYVTIVDKKETVTDATQGIKHVLGYDPDEIIGSKVLPHIHPEDRQKAFEAFASVLANPDTELNVEYRVRAADGSYRWIEGRGRNHLDDPLIEGVLVNVRDISQRKQRERELEELTTRLELTLTETNTGVWEWDLSTDEVVWDTSSERLFGYEPGDFPGTYEGFVQHLSDEDHATVKAAVAEAIETGQQYQADFSIGRPDGEQRWIRSRGSVEYDADGDPKRLLGVQTDVTDRKTAEQALETTKERYRRIFQLSTDYVTVLNESGEITDITPGVKHVLGYAPDEVIGTTVFDYIHAEDRDQIQDALTGALANPERQLNIECRVQTEATGYRWIEARGHNHLDDPLLEGVVVNVRDISQRKEREQELSQLTSRLKQKNDQLERLAQIVSHDLQTPLSTAQKLTQLLRTDLGTVDAEINQSLTDLELTHQRLREFADHLPRLARESTDVDGPTECDLQAVAQRAWSVVDTGSLELTIESTRGLLADPERLQRLFENLFQNTVVHGVKSVDRNGHDSRPNTDRDSPKATTVRVGALDEGFYVEDDGPGIRPEQRDGLFEYGMGTGSGSGFGLAIVRTTAEAHGWEVSVVETDTRGIRFEIDTNTDDR